MDTVMNEFKQPSAMNLIGRNIHETMTNSGHDTLGQQQRRRWSPYEVNGGTVAAIVAENKVIMACDSRYV